MPGKRRGRAMRVATTGAEKGLALAVVGLAVWFRWWRIDSVPGLNGDEAWYGVWATDYLAGRQVPWRTPTGNPLNPFFLLPQVVLHGLLPPSVAVLRLPAVLCGVAVLPINFWLARRTLGSTAAWLSTLILAVLPVNLAYSRFAWDSSQSVLAGVVVVHLSLLAAMDQRRFTGYWTLSVAALAAAVLIHPTNVLLAPLVAAAWLPRLAGHRGTVETVARLRSALSRRQWLLPAVAAVALVAIFLTTAGTSRHPLVFFRNFARLLAGTTVYCFIPGSPGWSAAGSLGAETDFALLDAAWMVLLAVAALLAVRRAGSGAWPLRVLLVGAGACVGGFWLAAGANALTPHQERYGLCLVAPGVLLLAAGLAGLAEQTAARRRGVLLAAVLFGAGQLFGFYGSYFQEFDFSGGRSHVAFRTAGVEPKRQALQWVLAHSARGETWIVADDWWTYWPLRYFAAGRPEVRVWS